MKQKDQRTEDGEELANKGPFARPLSRGLGLMGEASARTQGARRAELFKRSPGGRSGRGSRAGACSRTKERGRRNVFKIKKAEKRTVKRSGSGGHRHIQVCYCRYQKDAWKGKGRRKKTLSSLEFLSSFLKTSHLRDGAEDYCRLFWETMLVSLDSNQPGSREAGSRVRVPEAASGSHVSVGATHPCSPAVCKDRGGPSAPGPADQGPGQAAISAALPPQLWPVPRGRHRQGKGGGTLPEGPLRTQCQPETAADVEQQHQGPTVPSCPSSSSTTTERTVKRPRVGGRPTRTKELAAGKTTCALSNSSQNNPFPRVSH